MSFFCHQCGLCCRQMDRTLNPSGKPWIVQKLIEEFPYKHKAEVCEKLKDNKCSVYENRPDLCNIDNYRKRVFPELGKEEFYNIIEGVCKNLMRDNGYSEDEIEEVYSERLEVS